MWLSDGEATDVRRNGTEIALDAGHPGAEFFIGARDEFGMIAFRAAQVAVAGPSGLVIRDLASGRRVGVVTSLPDVRAVATAPGGSWFIGGNHRVQRVAPDGSVTEVSLPDTFSVFELTLIGAALYVGGGPTGGGPNLYRLHADTLALQSRWTIFGGGSVTTVEAAGSVLAVAGESPEVALVDPGADGPVALFPGAGGRLAWWTAYDKTRDRLLVSSEAREVFAWVCSERRLLGRIPGVGPVRVSPHGRWYAVSGINGVSVVDPSNLSVVCTLELGEIPESPYKPSINAVEWTPDGRIAVLMDDGRLVLRAFDGSAPTPG